MEWLMQIFSGTNIALLGIALAVALPGVGSAEGVGIVGEAGAGLITEDPGKFSQILILQIIPGTQGIYGFVIGLFASIKLGILTGNIPNLTIMQGASFLMACLPIAIVGWLSAISQGRVAAGGVSIITKRPEEMFKGVMFAVVVEFYAILALLVSFLLLINLKI